MARADNVDYGPFEGGVNYSRAPEDIEPNEISDMSNCRIGPGGFVEKRLGTAKYKSLAAVGSVAVTACGEFREPTQTEIDFMVAGAVFYEYSSSAWTNRSASITITPGDDNTFEWARAHTKLILTNGVDRVIKWTGAGDNIANITMPGSATWAKHCAYWDNRLWLANTSANDDRLWYSNNDDVDTYVATSYYDFGAPVTAVEPFQNSLSVHTEDGIWVMTPTGNAEFPYQKMQRIGANPSAPRLGGAISGRAVLSLPNNQQLFVLKSGIYQWTGGDDIEKISGNLDQGYWPNLRQSRLHQCFATYSPLENEAWFFLPHGSTQTDMNHVMIYNTEMELWFGPYEGWSRSCASVLDDKIHAGSLSGILYDHGPADTYNDDSAAIAAHFTTGAPPPQGEPTARNRWLYTRTYFDNSGNYNVTVEQESSGVSGSSRVINVQGGGAILGSFELDADTVGTTRMLSLDSELTGYDPHSSIKFSNNNANEFFRIRHTHPHYKRLGRKRKRKAGVE